MDYVAQEVNQNVLKPYAPVVSMFSIPASIKAGEVDVDSWGVLEVDSFSEATDPDTYILKRPTAASLSAPKLAFTAGAAAEASQAVSVCMNPTEPLWVRYELTDGNPSVGDEVGTAADSYKVTVDGTGLYVYAVDTTEGLCLVRPFSSGATTTLYTIYTGGLDINDTFTVPTGGSYQKTSYSASGTLNTPLPAGTYSALIFNWPGSARITSSGVNICADFTATIELLNAADAVVYSLQCVQAVVSTSLTSWIYAATSNISSATPGAPPEDTITEECTKIRYKMVSNFNNTTGAGVSSQAKTGIFVSTSDVLWTIQ